MNKKFFVLIFTPVLFLLPHTSFADNSTTSTSTALTTEPAASSTPAGLQAPQAPAIITEINQAKALLENITLNHALTPVYKKNTKTLLRYQLGDKDIALAILDPASGNVIITVGRLSINNKMVFPDPAVSVQLTTFNGVNSKFQVNQPVNGVVLALKYLISSTQSGSKAQIEAGLSPVVYVPSSPALDSPDVIAYGESYLDGVINKVAQDLYGLPSQAVPGETITQAIPPSMIKSLIYAEHTDSNKVLSGDVTGALDDLNVIFATNQGDAYKYSVSNDGYASRGIAQFVKSTYDGLVKRHPEAFLNPDYVLGMQDHENSIKAMYLLLDDDAGAVRAEATNSFVASRAFEYGAACYNAGSSRVVKAVATFGDSWDQDRSAQINSLQAQINSLKVQVKKSSGKTKTTLNSQLTDAENQLTQTKAASLTNTTLNYLNKIYKVVPYFNQQELAMN